MTRVTANGRSKLQLVGGTDAPRHRPGWSSRMGTAGGSGSAPRQRRRVKATPRSKCQPPIGLAAQYVVHGLPELSPNPCTYKLGEFGGTDNVLEAMAYKTAYQYLNPGAKLELIDTRR